MEQTIFPPTLHSSLWPLPLCTCAYRTPDASAGQGWSFVHMQSKNGRARAQARLNEPGPGSSSSSLDFFGAKQSTKHFPAPHRQMAIPSLHIYTHLWVLLYACVWWGFEWREDWEAREAILWQGSMAFAPFSTRDPANRFLCCGFENLHIEKRCASQI